MNKEQGTRNVEWREMFNFQCSMCQQAFRNARCGDQFGYRELFRNIEQACPAYCGGTRNFEVGRQYVVAGE